MYKIEYYTKKGKCPVLEFIQLQSPKEQAKIIREINLLEEFGLALGMPHIKKKCKVQKTYGNYELNIVQTISVSFTSVSQAANSFCCTGLEKPPENSYQRFNVSS